MFCRNCGHEQSSGKFCDVCGKQLGVDLQQQPDTEDNTAPEPAVTEAPLVKKSKAPIIAAAAVGVVAVGAGLVFMLTSGNDDSVNTDKDIKVDGTSVSDTQAVADSTADEQESSEAVASKAETTDKAEEEPVPVVEEKPVDFGWIDAYIEAAEKYKADYNNPSIEYRLMYINDDDIPEVYLRNSGTDHGLLYTYVDGEAVVIHETLSARSAFFAAYIERSGKYYAYDNDPYTGNSALYFYTLGNDGNTELVHTAILQDDKYNLDGEIISQSEYEKLYEGYSYVMSEESINTFIEFKNVLYAFDPSREPEEIEIISAVDIMNMTKDELMAVIGDNYRVSLDEFEGTGGYITGITSDEYFPNVMISLSGDNEQQILNNFRSFSGGSYFDYLIVNEGGLIGDGAKVGDTYNDMLTKIDCLNGIGAYQPFSKSIIGGYGVTLWFETNGDVYTLGDKYGANIVDLYDTNYGDSKCYVAYINATAPPSAYTDGYYKKATVTGDGVALRAAPYSEAVNLWSIEKGATVYVGENVMTDSNGEDWYQVYEYRTKDGVWKTGYMHAEYVKIN